jgi:hypothetical protein
VTNWIRRSIVVPLSTLAIAAAGVSLAHAACPPRDAVCLGEEAAGTGQNVVNDPIGPVGTPGDDTIPPVTDTVDPVLGDFQDRLDDILSGAGVDPPDPIGGGGGGRSHSPGKGSRGASSHAPGHDGPAYGRIHSGPGLHGATAPTVHAPSRSAPSAPLRDSDLASRDRFDAALGGVARSLAIVLALFGLAVGFVAIQDRFDRNDPRLALAPVESDIVEFA